MNDPAPLVVANLKANKTWDELGAWLDVVGSAAKRFLGTVVVCPSSPFLVATHQKLQSASWLIKLGSQDVSKFEQGAYTGEVAASQIASVCQYAIIGHSERRQHFREDETILAQKVRNAQAASIKPIYCVQTALDLIPEGVEIVAYEPVFAIGTGSPDSPENVLKIAHEIKQKGTFSVLYGGSVSPENIKSFLLKGAVDGVLVGATNSLDPQKFIKILEIAST